MPLRPAKPLSYFHTDIQLHYSQTHHWLSYFRWGPVAPESRDREPCCKDIHSRCVGQPWKPGWGRHWRFSAGKGLTQAGLSRYDLRSYRWVESYYRDPGKCDWRLQLGFCDFLIESVVNKCNFILDIYGDTVDIQHYQVEWMNVWVTQRHRYVDQSTP